MPDRENVIKGVECCVEDAKCVECPYYKNGVVCSDRLIDDLKELLKEQEPVEMIPECHYKDGYTDTFSCSNCGGTVTLRIFARECDYEFCPYCGRAVKWDA